MPIYLDTRGETDLAIAICARCSMKYPRTHLTSDPNSPGLMVCPDGCKDEFDPWRLPAREPDDITLEWARPDLTFDQSPSPATQGQFIGRGIGYYIIGQFRIGQ